MPRHGRKTVSSTASLVNVHCLQQCRQICSEVPARNSRAELLHEGEPAIAEGEHRAGTALPSKDAAPPHPSRVGHCRAPPKQSDSSGPLFFQGLEEKEALPKMKKEKEAGQKTH